MKLAFKKMIHFVMPSLEKASELETLPGFSAAKRLAVVTGRKRSASSRDLPHVSHFSLSGTPPIKKLVYAIKDEIQRSLRLTNSLLRTVFPP
jgi:hypothetical protein